MLDSNVDKDFVCRCELQRVALHMQQVHQAYVLTRPWVAKPSLHLIVLTSEQSARHSRFSDFVFKIRLIRLEFSFKKLKIHLLYFTTY